MERKKERRKEDNPKTMSLAAERRTNLRLSIPPEASNSTFKKEHPCEKKANARIMPARDRRISMLTRILEPNCNEPFHFLFMTARNIPDRRPDGQSTHEFRRIILHVNEMKPIPKFIALCGGFSDRSSKDDEILARKSHLEEELLCLDPRIKVLYVASSDDFRGHLDEDCIDDYRLCFGDDWYEFWVCGVAFLVINTVYFKKQIDKGLDTLRKEQNDWIESQLLQQQIFQAKRTIVLQDRVSCKSRCSDEGDVAEEQLEELLLKYNIAGVSHLLCREGCCVSKSESDECGVEVLPNEASESESWFVRLVKISTDEVYHKSFTLQDLPKQVYF